MGNFSCFLSSADFFPNHLFRKKNSGIPSVSNSLDPDQSQHFVWPDLGTNCLQRISADDNIRQRVQESHEMAQSFCVSKHLLTL